MSMSVCLCLRLFVSTVLVQEYCHDALGTRSRDVQVMSPTPHRNLVLRSLPPPALLAQTIAGCSARHAAVRRGMVRGDRCSREKRPAITTVCVLASLWVCVREVRCLHEWVRPTFGWSRPRRRRYSVMLGSRVRSPKAGPDLEVRLRHVKQRQ